MSSEDHSKIPSHDLPKKNQISSGGSGSWYGRGISNDGSWWCSGGWEGGSSGGCWWWSGGSASWCGGGSGAVRSGTVTPHAGPLKRYSIPNSSLDLGTAVASSCIPAPSSVRTGSQSKGSPMVTANGLRK